MLSKPDKKVVNKKQLNLKYFVTLIFYKHGITREKKKLNIPQRDSYQNWYHRNCES